MLTEASPDRGDSVQVRALPVLSVTERAELLELAVRERLREWGEPEGAGEQAEFDVLVDVRVAIDEMLLRHCLLWARMDGEARAAVILAHRRPGRPGRPGRARERDGAIAAVLRHMPDGLSLEAQLEFTRQMLAELDR